MHIQIIWNAKSKTSAMIFRSHTKGYTKSTPIEFQKNTIKFLDKKVSANSANPGLLFDKFPMHS